MEIKCLLMVVLERMPREEPALFFFHLGEVSAR